MQGADCTPSPSRHQGIGHASRPILHPRPLRPARQPPCTRHHDFRERLGLGSGRTYLACDVRSLSRGRRQLHRHCGPLHQWRKRNVARPVHRRKRRARPRGAGHQIQLQRGSRQPQRRRQRPQEHPACDRGFATPPEDRLHRLVPAAHLGSHHAGLSDVPAWYAARIQSLAQAHHLQPLVNLQLQYSLVERNIEREYVDLAQELGYGITAWSPLGMGLLSGKYRPSEAGADGGGEGRLQLFKQGGLPALQDKFTQRNFAIVAEVEKAAQQTGLGMAQVAIQWVARQPAIGSVILGARTLEQFEDNLASLDKPLPDATLRKLEEASALPQQFPYSFFDAVHQAGMYGGVAVGDKPAGYSRSVWIDAAPRPDYAPGKPEAA